MMIVRKLSRDVVWTDRRLVAKAGDDVLLADGPRPLIRYPGKRPLLRVSTRPSHPETPFAVFNEGPITANGVFFVRYHLANIPLSMDTSTYRLAGTGMVNSPRSLQPAWHPSPQ